MSQQKGFTLVEMLIALTIMAVMAGLSWQGLDAMSRSRQHNQVHHEQVLTLATGLAQWGTDLDALQTATPLPPLELHGKWLRMTRRSPLHDSASESLVVVAYAQAPNTTPEGLSGPVWLRWQSEGATTTVQLQTRWAQAKAWADSLSVAAPKQGVRLAHIQDWRLAVSREGLWQPAAPGAMSLVPEALRLELELSLGQPVSGTLRRDWIRPTAGGTR